MNKAVMLSIRPKWVEMFSVVIGSQSLPGFQGIAEQKRTKSGTFSTGILLASLPVTG